MAEIYRLVPILEIGPLKIGSRKGKPIPVTELPRTVSLSGEPKLGLGDWVSIQLAVIKGPDRVCLAVSNGETYQEYGKDIVGLGINTHPALGRKLRFEPTVQVSVYVRNDRKFQLR